MAVRTFRYRDDTKHSIQVLPQKEVSSNVFCIDRDGSFLCYRDATIDDDGRIVGTTGRKPEWYQTKCLDVIQNNFLLFAMSARDEILASGVGLTVKSVKLYKPFSNDDKDNDQKQPLPHSPSVHAWVDATSSKPNPPTVGPRRGCCRFFC